MGDFLGACRLCDVEKNPIHMVGYGSHDQFVYDKVNWVISSVGEE